ncbi:MAG: glycosyltransferase [Elusimicrobiota bacterium]
MKKKVLFIIHSIHGGGAQKQMQYIIRNLDRNRYDPYLCVFKITGADADVLPAGIRIYDLSTKLHPATLFLTLKLMRLLIRLKPDKVLSFMWSANIVSLLATSFFKISMVISERIYTPLSIKKYSFWKIKRRMISSLYKRASKIIAVSDDVKKGLVDEFFIPENLIHVINNGINSITIEKLSNEYEVELKDYVFACGTLEKKKNFSLLIDAMKDMKGKPLVILGKGSQESLLRRKAEENMVNLVLPGYLENPYPYFKNAGCFVLTSEYEGFPNVILESMALEVPVVSVDCPGGIKEIIKDGKDGSIVDAGDAHGLAVAIKKILEEKEYRDLIIRNAKEKVKNFSLDSMIKKYEDIIS